MGIWAGKNRDHKNHRSVSSDPPLRLHISDITFLRLYLRLQQQKKRIADTSIAKSTPLYALTSDLIFV